MRAGRGYWSRRYAAEFVGDGDLVGLTVTGQRADILCFRYGSNTYVSARTEVAYAECFELWWNCRGDHGGHGVGDALEYKYYGRRLGGIREGISIAILKSTV
jgi:hypothetical protein